MFYVDSKSPIGAGKIFQVIVSGIAVLLIKGRIIKLVGVVAIPHIIYAGDAKEQFILDDRRPDPGTVPLLVMIANTYFCKTVCCTGRLPGNDVYNATHCISSI